MEELLMVLFFQLLLLELLRVVSPTGTLDWPKVVTHAALHLVEIILGVIPQEME